MALTRRQRFCYALIGGRAGSRFILGWHAGRFSFCLFTHHVVGEPNKKPPYGYQKAIQGLSRSLVTLGLGCYDRTHQAYAGLVPRDDNLPLCATSFPAKITHRSGLGPSGHRG